MLLDVIARDTAIGGLLVVFAAAVGLALLAVRWWRRRDKSAGD
jgi:hypothetical protein